MPMHQDPLLVSYICCSKFMCHYYRVFSHSHDDVIKWKYFPRYWPFVREIHRSPVNFPHKGQWRGALMFTLICARMNGWVNNREAGDLRRYLAHYDVIVMGVSMVVADGLVLSPYQNKSYVSLRPLLKNVDLIKRVKFSLEEMKLKIAVKWLPSCSDTRQDCKTMNIKWNLCWWLARFC